MLWPDGVIGQEKKNDIQCFTCIAKMFPFAVYLLKNI